MKIQILDPVHCKVDKDSLPKLLPCLAYKKTNWRPGRYHKKKTTKEAYMVDKRNGLFLTGLLLKVQKYCLKKKISLTVTEAHQSVIPKYTLPELPGITFREDQIELNRTIPLNHRGIILSPTGSGKTILAAAIASMYPKARILFLAHTKSIIRQTFKKLKEFGKQKKEKSSKHFKSITLMAPGEKDLSKVKGRIVVSTIQTFCKCDPELYCDLFDIIIIDEVHHASNRKGTYAKVLEQSLAPIRIGFTATLPSTKEKRLSLEGFLGPVIGELLVEEAIEKGICAKPVITLIPVPYNTKIGSLRKYRDIYEKGIIQNRTRNRLIMKKASECIRNGKSVLIMVVDTKNEHGLVLQKYGKSFFGIESEVIVGKTEDRIREQVQEALEKKEVKCVIATAVWREGIDIRSLDTVINGCGHMSETMTLQTMGRGLRATEEKSHVEIVDFLDPYNYLARHTVMRLKVYVENGWL